MARGKKQSERGGGGGYLQVAAAALVLLTGLWAAINMSAAYWGGRGCTDVSALNFQPSATVDDGSCIASMYEQSGVFEFQTKAAAEPGQIEAIGMEFEHKVPQQMVVVTKVNPGSAAASSGVRAGDELLALKDQKTTVLVSSRGNTGVLSAVQHVMGARPGTQLTWVLRHAAALGGIEDIDQVRQAAAPRGLSLSRARELSHARARCLSVPL